MSDETARVQAIRARLEALKISDSSDQHKDSYFHLTFSFADALILAEQNARLEAVVNALIGTNICYNHFQNCRYEYRYCTCGHTEIVNALANLDAQQAGEP